MADLGRGWQCHISSFAEHRFRELVVLPRCSPSRRALLLSQSGGAASAWLRALPSETALRMRPTRTLTAVRRRLRWCVPLSRGTCCRGCRKELGFLGDRAAACGMSGRIKLRSRPLEKMWARVLREAGARVRENMMLRDTGVPGIDPNDGRRIDVVATGLPLAHGRPVAVDATLISPLHADGSPWSGAERTPGISFQRALSDKHRTYPELTDSDVVQLVVAATETGGRLSAGALELLDAAAQGKAQDEPPVLRQQAARSWRARWQTLLGVAAQDALAATLLQEGTLLLDAAAGQEPTSIDVWLDGAALQ